MKEVKGGSTYYRAGSDHRPAPQTAERFHMEFIRRFRKWILIAGLISIVLGYVFLSQNSISLAPALLVLGYCILIPVALI